MFLEVTRHVLGETLANGVSAVERSEETCPLVLIRANFGRNLRSVFRKLQGCLGADQGTLSSFLIFLS